jgi:hypothetical protein
VGEAIRDALVPVRWARGFSELGRAVLWCWRTRRNRAVAREVDETGFSNVIVNPDLYEKYRVVINGEKFLRVEGVLQNQDHTISVKASRVQPISFTSAETQSHDFH